MSRCALILLCLGWAEAGYSQACCNAMGSQDFAVVGRCQEAVIAVQTSSESALGSTDRAGEYARLSNGVAQDFSLTIGGATRLIDPRLQIGAFLPMRAQHRAFDGADTHTETGIGDGGLSARFTVLQDSMTGIREGWRPFMDVIVSTIVPLGRAPSGGEAGKSGADVFGEGRWGVGAGLQVSAYLTSRNVIDVLGQYHFRVPLGSQESSRHDFNARLSYLHIPTLRWSWGAGFLYRQVMDGETPLGGSGRHAAFKPYRTCESNHYNALLGTWSIDGR